jgi:RyR domain
MGVAGLTQGVRDLNRILIVARTVHEAIRAYQVCLGEPPSAAWDDAQEWERSATFAGVKFRMENPAAPASAQHEQWMQEKIASGWTLGPVKDPVKKTHPSLVPYRKLSETERRKDMLFAAVVRALTDPIS